MYVQAVTYLGSTLTSARSLVLSHTISTGIRQYFTVVEREECDLPSSKHSRLDEGDHDEGDGSSIAAEEDMDEQESISHDNDSSILTST